ncbi:cation:proton antiporter [Arthrobacter mobilis]|uniref:Sodium:proton antiporter n=1 Tax=Arthrobacter mobilis TaxID=2724944 RepID=A0A7X6K316_9MICC|nr:sodium:proton antiporter [Arthrobacter mobilis]NKX53035.1 sodium:proton antiporter [Arthrobacter mobilis]
MDQLALIVGLLFSTVLAVGLGERLRLPYPVLMLLLAVALTFIPGFPQAHIEPELILPLFLPPLLFATAQRSSWAVFRIRWRTIVMFAVALVVVTVALVAGAAWLLIPGIGIPAAIALGAMVAPPDPVAVESVAGRVHMPRRLLTTLQSEGLFNDAAAIVIFQAAAAAAVTETEVGSGLLLQFLVGAVIAAALGYGMGWLTGMVTHFVHSLVARSAITLVMPFAVYILAEQLHASGVVAVVVTALEIKRRARPQDAGERITRTAFWDVVEMLATGLAFGLMGLEMREVIQEEGTAVFGMAGMAAAVCAIVVAVRFGWMALAMWIGRRREGVLPPTSWKDVLILSWCGMRGLATLALALSMPATLADGAEFAPRQEITVIACAVLLVTLVLPGLTLPWLMKVLGAQATGAEEREAAVVLAGRAQEAAVAALQDSDVLQDLPEDKVELVKARMKRLRAELLGAVPAGPRRKPRDEERELLAAVQTIALAAARQEVLAARNEPDTDPEVADRVLRQLDLRTLVMPD